MGAKTLDSVVIAPHRYAFGYYRQAWWNWLIGSAFFLGEIGAGLFLISLLTGSWTGMALGYVIVMVGKNTAHLLYLGRPGRFWRAAMRPDRSWIARGVWATGVFAASGFLLLFPHYFGSLWPFQIEGSTLLSFLAGASALFLMFYDGFVMRASPSIPFWHTVLLPLLCLTYAALGGTTLSLALRVWSTCTGRPAWTRPPGKACACCCAAPTLLLSWDWSCWLAWRARWPFPSSIPGRIGPGWSAWWRPAN